MQEERGTEGQTISEAGMKYSDIIWLAMTRHAGGEGDKGSEVTIYPEGRRAGG